MTTADQLDDMEKRFANPLIIALAAAHETHTTTGETDDLKELYSATIDYLKTLTFDQIVAIVMVTAERGADFLREYANYRESVEGTTDSTTS